MARIRFFLVLVSLSLASLALADGPLYGLRNPGDFGRQLVTLDPATGAVTAIGGSIDPPNATSQGQVALDSDGGRFFFIGTPGVETNPRIYTLDTATGAVISNPTVLGQFLAIEYDEDDDVLYGLINPGDGSKQLVSIDENTGVLTPIGPTIGPAPLGVTLGVHAIDSGGNRFFFGGMPLSETTQRVYTLDTQTGALLSSPPVAGQPILGIEYDDGEDVLYGLINPGDGGKQLGTVDPATAAFTPISASIDPPLPNVAGANALDEAGNRFFFLGSSGAGDNQIYSVDTATGAVLANPFAAETSTKPIF